MSEKFIYLDHNSTTPVEKDVVDAMMPFFNINFGNPSSNHHFGNVAFVAVENARNQVASVINASLDEVVFTSGATESNNLVLKGVVESSFRNGINIVISNIEHSSVLNSALALSKYDVEVRFVKNDEYGFVDVQDLNNKIDENTVLVSVMTANNEIGTIQPVAEIGEICKNKNVLFHSDAVQAFGKIPLNVSDLNIDFLSISAHKIYGPKGVGALYINKNAKKKISAQLNGGAQEYGLRSGTLNVPGIVGLGKASDIAKHKMFDDFRNQIVLRDILIEKLLKNIDFSYLNGPKEKRLPNNVNISFESVDSNTLISKMKNVALSSGSACSSATLQQSYVLKALGKPDYLVKSAVRLGVGRSTTLNDINFVVEKLINIITEIRI